MVNKIHFISGLPRSGSTLLGALLRQNPRFTAAMSSPVFGLVNAVHKMMSGGEVGVVFDDAKRAAMLKGIFNSYYEEEAEGTTVFDTNRAWTSRPALLAELYPESRIICCVRETGWIIDSFELMLRKNPLQHSQMFTFQHGASLYTRVEAMMNSDNGQIGTAWCSLREAWYSEQASRLIIVPYDHLVDEPEQTLQRLYAELGEEPFAHDLHNVSYDAPAFDEQICMPGLHKVRKKVEYIERDPCIPPDIFVKYASTCFWDHPDQNPRNVVIV
jgi:sulfotransferase